MADLLIFYLFIFWLVSSSQPDITLVVKNQSIITQLIDRQALGNVLEQNSWITEMNWDFSVCDSMSAADDCYLKLAF